MAESREDILRRTQPEQIIKAYTGGRIKFVDYKQAMVDKAMQVNTDAFGGQGYMMAYASKIAEQFQKGWDNVKQAALSSNQQEELQKTEPQPFNVQLWNELRNSGRALWGMAQMINAIPSGFGEVNGLFAERRALQMGLSPDAAKFIGITADTVTSAVVPSVAGAVVTKIGVKGGIAAGKALGIGAKAAGAQGELNLDSQLMDKVIVKAMETSLKEVGVEGTVLTKAAPTAEAAGPKLTQTLSSPKPQYVATDTGAVIDTATGEVISKQTLSQLPTKIAPETTTTLPSELAGAKPRYGYGSNQYELAFKSDVDKALYIVAQQKPSKRDAVYMEWLQGQFPDKSAAELRAMGGTVREEIKAMAKDAVADPSISQLTLEATAVGRNVSAAPMHIASVVAEEKLGVPQNQVHDMLTAWAPDQIAKGNVDGAANQFVNDMSKLTPEKAAEMRKYVMEQFGGPEGASSSLMQGIDEISMGSMVPKWQDVTEIYRNLLLASPVGRVRDTLSNIGASVNYIAQRQVGAMLPGSETSTMGTVYYAKGMTAALHEAFDSFTSAFKAGGMSGDVTKFDNPITEELGRVVNAPTGVVVGIDRFFKTLHRRGSLYAQELEASAASGEAFNINNVNFPSKERMDKAVQLSEYLTYQNDLGRIGKGLQGIAGTPGVDLYFPFMKTPINLMKYAWNNTPVLNIASKRLVDEIAQGGAAADAAMGRLIISNMFGFYVSELAKNEMITGGGPADPGIRAQWLKTHEPYSLRVGDHWVPLNPAAPFSHVVGMIADYAQIAPDIKDPAMVEKLGQTIMIAVEHNIGENSWWKEAGQLTDAVNTLGKSDPSVIKMEKIAAAPFVSMITGGSLGGVIKQTIDPVSRAAYEVIDQERAKMPVWSLSAPPNRDGYGDVIVPPQAIGGRWATAFNPVKMKDVNQDPMHMEGDRLNAKLPSFGMSVGGATQDLAAKYNEATPQDIVPKSGVGISIWQKDEMQQIYGNYMQNKEFGIPGIMATDEYKNAPDALKKQMYEGTALSAHGFAQRALVMRHPELAIEGLRKDAAHTLPMLANDPQQMDDAQRSYANAIDYFEQLSPDQVNNLLKYSPVESDQ